MDERPQEKEGDSCTTGDDRAGFRVQVGNELRCVAGDSYEEARASAAGAAGMPATGLSREGERLDREQKDQERDSSSR